LTDGLGEVAQVDLEGGVMPADGDQPLAAALVID
jgi:hypothetical protein